MKTHLKHQNLESIITRLHNTMDNLLLAKSIFNMRSVFATQLPESSFPPYFTKVATFLNLSIIVITDPHQLQQIDPVTGGIDRIPPVTGGVHDENSSSCTHIFEHYIFFKQFATKSTKAHTRDDINVAIMEPLVRIITLKSSPALTCIIMIGYTVKMQLVGK